MVIHILLFIYGYSYMIIHIWLFIYDYSYMIIHMWLFIYAKFWQNPFKTSNVINKKGVFQNCSVPHTSTYKENGEP